jgi:general nucleoside transport system permease protein
MLQLEPRPEPSRTLALVSPLLALLLTTLLGVLLFAALGQDPLRCLELFFVEPLRTSRALGELSIKATPLLLIALGLCVCFRSNVWNIGAEGQFILGAIAASGVAIRVTPETSHGVVGVILLAGVAGGMAWGAISAALRDRFNANEILVSLMLVYVAEQLLGYLVAGPWKDPHGYNFPQTVTFASPARVPKLFDGARANLGLPLALVLAAAFWTLVFRTHAGYKLTVGGLAPLAARYAGFSSRRALWTAFLLSGGMAGLAGALEVAGPVGQLTSHVPVGYGFAAIIVAFVGRLNPAGAVLAAVLLSMFYIGGELSQARLGLPKSLAGVFQGLLLFALLACDVLIHHRVRFRARGGRAPASRTPLETSTPAAAAPKGWVR